MSQAARKTRVAADLMQTDLVVVHTGESLQDAMGLMTENHVTGLPVVDAKSRCVGVVTATDILNYEQEHSEFTSEANTDLAQHFDQETQRWESVRLSTYALEEFAEVSVEAVMSRELVSVGPKTPLEEVARTMAGEKIHRVLVVDEEQHLFGIISAFDFVGLYARSESA